MSAERTAPHDQPDDTSEKPRRTGLSGLQVATSALAAASTAVVMSFFGVAGTVIGAGLASVITTVSAAVYGESLRRTSDRLRSLRTTGTHEQPAASSAAASATPAAPASPPALGRKERAAAAVPARLDPRRPAAPRRLRWSRVAVSAAAVFGLAMVLITSIELVGQRPVSALVGASSVKGTTTVGEIAGGGAAPSTGPSAPPSGATTPASPTRSQSPAPSDTGGPASDAPTTTPGRSTPDRTSATSSSAARPTDRGATGSSQAPAAGPTAP